MQWRLHLQPANETGLFGREEEFKRTVVVLLRRGARSAAKQLLMLQTALKRNNQQLKRVIVISSRDWEKQLGKGEEWIKKKTGEYRQGYTEEGTCPRTRGG